MAIVTGTALVLVTWAFCLVSLTVIGLPLAALAHQGGLGANDLRRGLWWGLLVVTVVAYLSNLVWPLSSGQVAALFGSLLAVASAVSYISVSRRGWRQRWHIRPWVFVLGSGLFAVVVYLAAAALGPVTNYDSGLYHLGAIRYAADYATIPGLANLYFPFGYGNAEFPLAALLGNGPWGVEGFRLLNGLVIAGLCLDLVLRSATRRRGPGFYVLIVGAVALLIPMVALSDYWVTSPSQDSAVFALTVAASAAFADCIAGRRVWVADAAVAVTLGVLLVLLRPTMVTYLVTVVALIAVMRWRRGAVRSPGFGRAATLTTVMALVAGVAAAWRDYILSGWLQYPLSLLSFDVPWLAPDPINDRLATLGYHRDPGDLWGATEGFAWIPAWLARLPQQWETVAIVVLGLAAAAALVWASRVGQVRWRGAVVATTPSLLAVLVWFFATPPSFRFAWGPVFTVLTVPLGWALWRLYRAGVLGPRRQLALVSLVALGLVTICLGSAATRLMPDTMSDSREWVLGIRVPYAVTPLPTATLTSGVLPGGVTLQMPLDGEQCWTAFPVCTPRYSSSLRSRSDDLADGFVSR